MGGGLAAALLVGAVMGWLIAYVEVPAILATLGVGIGPDANAQTSYDDTQYLLRVHRLLAGITAQA